LANLTGVAYLAKRSKHFTFEMYISRSVHILLALKIAKKITFNQWWPGVWAHKYAP